MSSYTAPPAATGSLGFTLNGGVFISGKILDGNSPVRFHKFMAAIGLTIHPGK